MEYKRYHRRLAELVAIKKGDSYTTTMSWTRARVSFALLRSALRCLRSSRVSRRVNIELSDIDLDIEKGHANIRYGVENAISFSFFFFSKNAFTLENSGFLPPLYVSD